MRTAHSGAAHAAARWRRDRPHATCRCYAQLLYHTNNHVLHELIHTSDAAVAARLRAEAQSRIVELTEQYHYLLYGQEVRDSSVNRALHQPSRNLLPA